MGIEKHIKVTGRSTISWKDATVKTLEEVAKTLDYITSLKILDQRAKVTVNKMTEYYVDLSDELRELKNQLLEEHTKTLRLKKEK